jgi:phosphatidylglycerol:prolipoprotein diacylglycerol transferase
MHPVLLHLPSGHPLYGYGTMLLVAMLAGSWVAVRLGERDGIDRDVAVRCIAWTLLCALVGARLLFVLVNAGRLEHLADVFRVWKGGVVAYGGFLGGLAGAALYCRRSGVRLLAWADCAAPGVAAGLVITRVGCLLAGCDFGRAWDGPWALAFPAGSPAFRQHQLAGLLPPGATESLPVHPTQIYESLVGLALLVFALWLWRRRAFPGQVFLSVAIGYGLLRAALELLRADTARGGVGPLSTSQLIGLATAAVAAAVLLARSRRPGGGPTSRRPRRGGEPFAAHRVPAAAAAGRQDARARRRRRGRA